MKLLELVNWQECLQEISVLSRKTCILGASGCAAILDLIRLHRSLAAEQCMYKAGAAVRNFQI